MRRTLPFFTLAFLLLALPSCELSEDPTADAVDVISGDVAKSDDASKGDSAAPVDIGATPEPVPCSVLNGRWQVSLCEGNAVPVEFLSTGCAFLISSADPTWGSGNGQLVNGVVLALALPGGAAGQLQCEAEMKRSSFDGRCASATGSCAVVGVKAW